MTSATHGARSAPIGAVERDTGLSKDTLRVWERRYGFPRPERDPLGERRYSVEDIAKLRVIKRLIDQGHRPGKIIELPAAELQQLAQQRRAVRKGARVNGEPALSEQRADLHELLALVKTHQIEAVRNRFGQLVMQLGLGRFVTSVVAPLNDLVGDAWMRGGFEVFEEHLYTEAVQVALRNAIHTMPQVQRRPQVLLTTFPQESHGIGILMAEAMLSLEGCRCVSLGTRTPIPDIARAAGAHKSDVVALSFSSRLGPNPVLDGLAELCAKLPAATEIWAGGACQVLHQRPPSQVRTFKSLDTIAPAVAQWRVAHAVT